MKLPNLEQYLRALQLPAGRIFTDPVLKAGRIETNALGTPRARSGNFALVFRIDSGDQSLAIRCFTRTSREIAARYAAISSLTQRLRRPGQPNVFLPFEYQANGILVEGQHFPIVKMGWSGGRSLGDFLSEHHLDKARLRLLRDSLARLAAFLDGNGVAHGDIQPGNVMVSDDARQLWLIDYDGMYVPELEGFDAAELGHVNFQHPLRNEQHFNDQLDRFSFILLDTALAVLIEEPTLWERTYSDEEGIVFRAGDLAQPLQSQTFALTVKMPAVAARVRALAEICMGPFQGIPRLADFQEQFAASSVPSQKAASAPERVFEPEQRVARTAADAAPISPPVYVGSYEVVPASSFVKVSQQVGKRVELIGKVVDVRSGKASFQGRPALRPYIYVDFSELSTGRVVRIKMLPEFLEAHATKQAQLPNTRWLGKWVTISEVIQPVQYIKHPAFAGGIGEASVCPNHPGQLRLISEDEARFRLASNNQAARARLKTRAVSTRAPSASPRGTRVAANKNMSILERLKNL